MAESLDAHRKQQQDQHPKLTITGLYNVLEKLRAGTPLDPKEQTIHEQGLVTVLRQFHDDLDAAVADAFGLSPTASDDAILAHLAGLNAQRATEEQAGEIRWLRPAFQTLAAGAIQTTLPTGEESSVSLAKTVAKTAWPKTIAQQVQVVRSALVTLGAPINTATLIKNFKGAKADRLDEIMETLASLGQARALSGGRYIGV